LNTYTIIQNKLQQFIKKHYRLVLTKGLILFVSLGALIFMFLLSLEYFLWLSSTGRLFLLLLLIGFGGVLLYKYILIPVFYLFKIKKGLSEKDASELIGNHFPEISDKLYNLFDLASHPEQSDLLLASIEQRSSSFTDFDFGKAINYKAAFKQIKFLVGPLLILLLLWFSGNISSFFGTYQRVINYDMAFEQPAPFTFNLLSKKLMVYEQEDYQVNLEIKGNVRPELVYILIDGNDFLMKEENGIFTYLIKSPKSSLNFSFLANDLSSKQYTLNVLETPSILDFSLELRYPKYINKKSEILKSVGDAILPEGTKVNWIINTNNTKRIALNTKDTVYDFKLNDQEFSLSKTIKNTFDYTITTSNNNVSNFESLSYSFKVIKDMYPTINVAQNKDSLQPNVRYFKGEITDDYGLKNVSLVYFDAAAPANTSRMSLLSTNGVVDEFYYTYPSGLELKENTSYSFYFEVADNDGINGSKISKSQVFSADYLDDNQLKNRQLIQQQSLISDFDKSLEKFKKQSQSLDKINTEQKEKTDLSFNDKQKVNNFLEKQELQEAQMQKFSKQLKENLQNLNKDDKLNQLLQERLERQEIQADKNKKLLEELQKVADKINKEELAQKLEAIAKKQKSSQRNLEQLLELTKQYYITEKASQLAKDLEKLADKQELLSKLKLLENDSKKNQSDLNKVFTDLDKSLDELKNDNNDLKKPLALGIDKELSNEVKTDQKSALEELNKQQGIQQSSESGNTKSDASKASKKQKSAADKMQEMSNKLAQSSSGGSSSTLTEDAEVLRQILDNLIVFTFKQENLMAQLNADEGTFANQSQAIIKQQELKRLFEHIDDSLFSLSLRVPEISEEINSNITEVFYNTDKAMDAIAESNGYQGASYQKYALTSGNTLSDLLASILENMQQSMKSGKGEGQGEDFQLPDIIKAQRELQDKMGQEGKEGEQGKEGKQGKEGENGQQGNNGKQGKQTGQGNRDNSGENGENSDKNDLKENKSGQVSGGTGNGGEGISEAEMKEIYEIYKQQEIIKNALENQLNNLIENADRQLAQKLLRQMEDFQDNLLENGITKSTIEKANIIQYQLLKLEGAALKQGKKNERESSASKNKFTNPITTKPNALNDFKIEEEILNRQALPLRQSIQTKIKEYFKNND